MALVNTHTFLLISCQNMVYCLEINLLMVPKTCYVKLTYNTQDNVNLAKPY